MKRKPHQPATAPARPAAAIEDRVVARPDGYYWVADDGKQEFGPFATVAEALAAGRRLRAHNFVASCVNMARGLPYWRDVGTVDAFWQANLELTRVVPDLNLYDREWPIWTWQEQLPPAKFVFDDEGRRGVAPDSLVASGCIVSGTTVRRSLLSTNVRIDDAECVEDSVLLPNVQVGEGAVLKRAVVDKYCRIPPRLVVGVDPELDRRRFHVTEKGVTLITPEMLGQRLRVRP